MSSVRCLKGVSRAGGGWRSAAVWCAIAGSMGACAPISMAPFVWVDEWSEPAPVSRGEYVVGVGDLLNVLVWEEAKMSAVVRVRSDGRISLPFLDDVAVAGSTPVSLARRLEERLKPFIVAPKVTVVVAEAKPLSVSVLGEVENPGLYTLDPGSGIAQALAAAGGLKDFARKDRIFLLRTDDDTPRLRMTYADVTAKTGRTSALRVRTGDVVVVE